MAFGGILAILYYEKNKTIAYITSKPIQIVCWLIMAIHIFNYEILNSIISMEIVTAATGFIICGQIGNKSKIVNLENSIMNFLGKYSYGIYVYHPLIIFLLYEGGLLNMIQNETLRSILILITTVVLTILVAYISYEYFEKRFIKLKSKFAIVHSTNEKN